MINHNYNDRAHLKEICKITVTEELEVTAKRLGRKKENDGKNVGPNKPHPLLVTYETE